MAEMKVSVVGLGKLGACLAACLAAKGFLVTAFDIHPQIVASMGSRVAPNGEPGLQDLLDAAPTPIQGGTD